MNLKENNLNIEGMNKETKKNQIGKLIPKQGGTGFLDLSGNWVIKPIYKMAKDFSEGLAEVEKDGKWGFIDKTGKVVVEPQWDDVHEFSEGLAGVERDDKWGFIDKNGKVVIEPQWDVTGGPYYIFSEGLASVKKDGKSGYIDKTGKIVIEPQWGFVYGFSEGLAMVEKGRKWGFIDKTGKVVVEPEWDDARSFSDGLAAVEKDDNRSMIDKTGKIIIGPQFGDVYDYEKGYIRVGKGGKIGLMDKKGNWIIKPKYNIEFPSDGLVRANVSQYGLVDESGNWIVEPKYDRISDFYPIGKNGRELALAIIGEKQIWLDANGNECPDAIIESEAVDDKDRKTVPAKAYGKEWFIDALDQNGESIDGKSAFIFDKLCIVIDEKEYNAKDFSTVRINGFDATEFCISKEAAKGFMYINKASCYDSFNKIFLPDSGDFDQEKAVLLTSYWVTSEDEDLMGKALIYDGIKYNLNPKNSKGKRSIVVYGNDDSNSDEKDSYLII